MQVAHSYKIGTKDVVTQLDTLSSPDCCRTYSGQERLLQYEVSSKLLYCRGGLPPSILPFNAFQLISAHHNQLHSDANNSGDTVTR